MSTIKNSMVQNDERRKKVTASSIEEALMAHCNLPGNTTIAGKGGTGKTTLAQALVTYCGRSIMSGSVKVPGNMPIESRGVAWYNHCAKFLSLCNLVDLGSWASSVIDGVSAVKTISEKNRSEITRNLSVITETNAKFRSLPDNWSELPLQSQVEMMSGFHEDVTLFTESMHQLIGSVAAMRNEFTVPEPGLSVSLIDGRHLDYVIQLPTFNSSGGVAIWEDVISIDPVNLALALSFLFALRIGTINSAFGHDISYASTLKGGLSENTLLSLQNINDNCCHTGGHVFSELRDDFGSDSNNELELAISEIQTRVVSSSRIGIYLRKKDAGMFRVRPYSPLDVSIHEMNKTFNIFKIDLVSNKDGKPVIDHSGVTGLLNTNMIDEWSATVAANGGSNVIYDNI